VRERLRRHRIGLQNGEREVIGFDHEPESLLSQSGL
jgi:hypothetical protein